MSSKNKKKGKTKIERPGSRIAYFMSAQSIKLYFAEITGLSERDIKDIQEAFNLFDSDGSGKNTIFFFLLLLLVLVVICNLIRRHY